MITPQEALQRTIEHREIFHDEMLHLMRMIMRGELSPVLCAAILTGLRSVVGSFTAHHHIVIGVMFVVVVIVMPRGLIGYTTPLLQRWLDRRQAPAKERP